MASRPVRATAAQAASRNSARAPAARLASPAAPDSEGGLSRNSSSPTMKAAAAAARTGASSASLTQRRVRARSLVLVGILAAGGLRVAGALPLLTRNAGGVAGAAAGLARLVLRHLLLRALLGELVGLFPVGLHQGPPSSSTCSSSLSTPAMDSSSSSGGGCAPGTAASCSFDSQ